MAEEMTQFERRIRVLEAEATSLRAALASTNALAGKAAQDAALNQFDSGGDNSPFSRGQVITEVGPTAGPALGTGSVRLCTVITGVRYWKTDGTAGHHTDFTAYNDTGGPIPVNTFVVCGLVNGLMTVLVADCGTDAPAAAADDITSPDYAAP